MKKNKDKEVKKLSDKLDYLVWKTVHGRLNKIFFEMFSGKSK